MLAALQLCIQCVNRPLIRIESRCVKSRQARLIVATFNKVVQQKGCCNVQVHTVGVGVAIGQSCMLLSAGTKGKRFMLPHATGKEPCHQAGHDQQG